MSGTRRPQPASTIVLLREAVSGPEVFMLERSARADFLPSAYVFPGGGLDAADSDPRIAARVRGLDEARANARLGIAHGALAYWIAAVRECFEESGILLATEESGAGPAAQRVEAFESARAAMNAGTLGFVDFLERERLFIDAARIAYFSHWVTPPMPGRRYDTRFFVAVAPAGQHGAHDDLETVHSLWTRPADVLERRKRKEIGLIIVTKMILEDIARFPTPRAVVEHAAALESIPSVRPAAAIGREGRKVLRASDAAYAEVSWSDPDETGETTYDFVADRPKWLDRLVTRITAANPGYATGPGTNTYLVGGRELAVIDPGPALAPHVEAILAEGAGRIRWVLCTHTHRDHSPAAAAIQSATGATVIGRPAPAGASQDGGFRPDHVPTHGERLLLGDVALTALHTPGHASNHLCYLLEETRMLFTGDHVMQGSTVVITPPDGNMRTYLASLEGLLDRDLAILAPGHGYLIGDPHREVRRLIRHRGMREAKVLAALRRLGTPTLSELLPQVYDDVVPALHAMAAKSLTAHLDKLLEERRAKIRGERYSILEHT